MPRSSCTQRFIERRRAEDRERLRELDALRDKAGEWERVREKTRARVAELAGEVKELRREVRSFIPLFGPGVPRSACES